MTFRGYPELVVRYTRDREPPVSMPGPLADVAQAIAVALEAIDPHLRVIDVIRRGVREERMSDRDDWPPP